MAGKSEANANLRWEAAGKGTRFELSLASGFMDSAAASRGESPLPSVSFPSPVSSPRPRSAAPFLFSPVRVREHERGGGFSAMRPRCGRSCHCSGDRYPGSRLRVKVTTLYLESQLMPPPLSRDHPLIIDEPPSATVLTQLLRNLSPTPAVRRPCSSSLSLSLPLSLFRGRGGRRSTHFWKTEIGDPDNGDDLSIARRAR